MLTESGFISFCNAVSSSENPFKCLILDRCLKGEEGEREEGERERERERDREREKMSDAVAKAVVKMCDDCPSLLSLGLAGTFAGAGRIRHLFHLLSRLENQKSLMELDISNHSAGNPLAFAVGRILRGIFLFLFFFVFFCFVFFTFNYFIFFSIFFLCELS